MRSELAIALLLIGCSTNAPPMSEAPVDNEERSPPADEAPPSPTTPPAPTATTPETPPAKPSHKASLGVCWTDKTCNRAMIVGHGGDWTPTGAPYGSMAALVAAYEHDVDSVKIDVRVTKDNVPVVAHSSPFEAWESLDCYGRKVEDMTAADFEKCHFSSKSSEAYQRLDTMLAYAKGKMTVQLCVKDAKDYARTIAQVLTSNAEDFVYLEVSTADLTEKLPSLAGSSQVYYLINIEGDLDQVDVLSSLKNPKVFMIEMNAGPNVADVIKNKIHPAGWKAFLYEKSQTASPSTFKAHFDQGFDVVSANATDNNKKARIEVNKSRNVSPP